MKSTVIMPEYHRLQMDNPNAEHVQFTAEAILTINFIELKSLYCVGETYSSGIPVWHFHGDKMTLWVPLKDFISLAGIGHNYLGGQGSGPIICGKVLPYTMN